MGGCFFVLFISARLVIVRLVAIVGIGLAMRYHHMSFQCAFIGVCVVAKFAFEIVLSIHGMALFYPPPETLG